MPSILFDIERFTLLLPLTAFQCLRGCLGYQYIINIVPLTLLSNITSSTINILYDIVPFTLLLRLNAFQILHGPRLVHSAGFVFSRSTCTADIALNQKNLLKFGGSTYIKADLYMEIYGMCIYICI